MFGGAGVHHYYYYYYCYYYDYYYDYYYYYYYGYLIVIITTTATTAVNCGLQRAPRAEPWSSRAPGLLSAPLPEYAGAHEGKEYWDLGRKGS